MTRLIDADGLEKAIYEWMPKDQETWQDSDIPPIEDLVVSIMLTIQEQPTIEAVPHWILVSERLPEEDGPYIVYAPLYTGGSSSGKENHNGVMFSKFKNGKWSIECGYYNRPNCVKAWMPLPGPYHHVDN